MYALICGRGGVDPRYFLDEMDHFEARDIINGINQRDRQGWEQTRQLLFFIYRALGNEEMNDPRQFMPFSWDERDPEDKPPTEAELEALREKAAAWATALNNKK